MTVAFFGIYLLVFYIEHFRSRWTEDVGIEQTGFVACTRKCHCKVRCYGSIYLHRLFPMIRQ